jgi:hypothetical protein
MYFPKSYCRPARLDGSILRLAAVAGCQLGRLGRLVEWVDGKTGVAARCEARDETARFCVEGSRGGLAGRTLFFLQPKPSR